MALSDAWDGKEKLCWLLIFYFAFVVGSKIHLLLKCVKIENELLLLINLYNANTENEELSTLSDLSNVLDKIGDINNKSIVFGGDFDLFFKAKLEAYVGNRVLKKKSLAKLIQIKKKFALSDICRIRNINSKRYTSRQQHSSGYIQRRLDFFFVSNFYRNL